MVSKHVKRFGKHGLLNILINFSHLFLNAINLISIATTVYKFKGRPCIPQWLHHMSIYSCIGLNNSCYSQLSSLKPFLWLWFIDDMDMNSIHDREILEAFLKRANSFHSCCIYLYTKPTDSHHYNLYTSVAILLLIAARKYHTVLHFRRICSDDEGFEKREK